MFQNISVLIVDDDSAVRKALVRILRPASGAALEARGAALFASESSDSGLEEAVAPAYNLLLAESGEVALSKVSEALVNGRPVALAFIDMKMPGLDGAETARAIWKLDPRVKAVFVTAYSEAGPHKIIQVTGRCDHFYLRKPFTAEVIRQFARALTGQWQVEREREELDAELERKNRALEELNETLAERVKVQSELLFQSEKMASIGVLAAGVAHEINNPIGFIRSNLESFADYTQTFKKIFSGYQALAEVIIEGSLDDAKRQMGALLQLEEAEDLAFILDDIGEMVSESLTGAERISKIVKDLRYISRDDHEIISFVDLNKLLDSVLTILEHEFGGSIELQKEYGNLPEVSCFPQHLGQVFMQILLNAAQAIESNGIIAIKTHEIVKGRRRSDNRVVVSISDNGCGIAEADLKKVFDPFFTTRKVGTGTGLGMSLSHDIVKAHQGSIKVESHLGRGTTFTVELPVEVKGAVQGS